MIIVVAVVALVLAFVLAVVAVVVVALALAVVLATVVVAIIAVVIIVVAVVALVLGLVLGLGLALAVPAVVGVAIVVVVAVAVSAAVVLVVVVVALAFERGGRVSRLDQGRAVDQAAIAVVVAGFLAELDAVGAARALHLELGRAPLRRAGLDAADHLAVPIDQDGVGRSSRARTLGVVERERVDRALLGGHVLPDRAQAVVGVELHHFVAIRGAGDEVLAPDLDAGVGLPAAHAVVGGPFARADAGRLEATVDQQVLRLHRSHHRLDLLHAHRHTLPRGCCRR